MADVLEVLRKERDRLDRAIAILDGAAPRRDRRPDSASSISDATAGAGSDKRGRKTKAKRNWSMSREGRARMSAMMKKRWADRRKAAKKAVS